jgi:arabinose-5-phosphate isomerase
MSRAPRTITADRLVVAAVREMETGGPGPVTCLVVVEDRRPVGILHLHDCLGADPASPPA